MRPRPPHRIRPILIRAGVASAAMAGTVVAAEAVLATRREYVDPSSAPDLDVDFGAAGGRLIRLVVLGDSTGAGSGITTVRDSVGGQLALRLARAGWGVALSGVAVSGARCRDLDPQVARVLTGRPDVAVIVVGANDALRATSLGSVRADLGAAVARLRAADVRVVVGTCPDLGAARALAQPLRAMAGWRGRAVANVQASATVAAGGDPVDIGRITGPVFRADPGTLSADCFHPSADGYRLWAEALWPGVAAAAGSRRGR